MFTDESGLQLLVSLLADKQQVTVDEDKEKKAKKEKEKGAKEGGVTGPSKLHAVEGFIVMRIKHTCH